MNKFEKAWEKRIRRKAKKHGFRLEKSRARKILVPQNWGFYRVVDLKSNIVVFGNGYFALLDEVEYFLDNNFQGVYILDY